MDERIAFCPSCGRRRLAAARFCAGCGRDLRDDEVGDTSVVAAAHPVAESAPPPRSPSGRAEEDESWRPNVRLWHLSWGCWTGFIVWATARYDPAIFVSEWQEILAMVAVGGVGSYWLFKPEKPRRARLSGATRRQIWIRDGKRCTYCEKALPFLGDAHIDHVLPRHLGGSNDPSNLVLACATCNLRKGAIDTRSTWQRVLGQLGLR